MKWLFLVCVLGNGFMVSSQTKILSEKIWKSGCTGLVFWNPEISQNGATGYIDTFKQAGRFFRIVHHEEAYDGIVQRFNNGTWETDLAMEALGNQNSYARVSDLNNDGYPDLVLSWKWDDEVFLFDPAAKKFFKNSFRQPQEWALLDATKNIFCDYFEYKFVKSNHSELYTFKNNRKLVLFSLQFTEDEKDDSQQTIKSIILLNQNGKKIRETSLQNGEFDYMDYWKKNYRLLLKGKGA